jgi:5-methylcytosine-specific restriction endonuclease McrA
MMSLWRMPEVEAPCKPQVRNYHSYMRTRMTDPYNKTLYSLQFEHFLLFVEVWNSSSQNAMNHQVSCSVSLEASLRSLKITATRTYSVISNEQHGPANDAHACYCATSCIYVARATKVPYIPQCITTPNSLLHLFNINEGRDSSVSIVSA